MVGLDNLNTFSNVWFFTEALKWGPAEVPDLGVWPRFGPGFLDLVYIVGKQKITLNNSRVLGKNVFSMFCLGSWGSIAPMLSAAQTAVESFTSSSQVLGIPCMNDGSGVPTQTFWHLNLAYILTCLLNLISIISSNISKHLTMSYFSTTVHRWARTGIYILIGWERVPSKKMVCRCL